MEVLLEKNLLQSSFGFEVLAPPCLLAIEFVLLRLECSVTLVEPIKSHDNGHGGGDDCNDRCGAHGALVLPQNDWLRRSCSCPPVSSPCAITYELAADASQ